MPTRLLLGSYASLARRLPLAAVFVDERGRIEWLNPLGRELLSNVVGPHAKKPTLHLVDLFGAEDTDRVQSAVTKRSATTLKSVHFRSEKGVSAHHLEVEIVPIPSSKKARPTALLLLGEEPLGPSADAEQRAKLFETVYRLSHDAIEITDRDGLLVDVNPAFERIYGYDRGDLIGKKPRIVRSPRTPPDVYSKLWERILDPKVGHWSGELVNLDRSGQEHQVRLDIAAVRDSRGQVTHFLGIASDVSLERLLELQAVRAERLASLGQLATGVAHEINTPLANVLLIAESLKTKAPNPWVIGRSEAIIAQVETAGRIVQGLLDFSRSQPPMMTRLDLVGVVDEAVTFLEGKQTTKVEILVHHDQPSIPIKGDRIRLLQVFVNLLNNAYDALEGRGHIRLTSLVEQGTAEVRLVDDGPGIPPAVYPHLFEPFFTTKPAGKGTGLGLSICYGIVKAHGGEISATPPSGSGATFIVRIPLDSDPE